MAVNEFIGNRSTEEMDVLLASGKNSFNFASLDGNCFYQIIRLEEGFPYNISISYQAPDGTYQQCYEENYMTLQNLIDHEPFDLSKFAIEGYRDKE